METVILQTVCTKELKTENISITQHHLGHHVQIITNEAFTIGGHPGKIIGFTALSYVSTPIMSFISPTLLLATWEQHHMPEEQFMRAIYHHPL